MQVTTHSDYLIKRFNNLINLQFLKNKIDKAEFVKMIDKWGVKETFLLDAKSVGSYILKRNQDGTSKIVEQDMQKEKEISFGSFYSAIEDDMALTREIRKYIEE